jgi:hypothetical protein
MIRNGTNATMILKVADGLFDMGETLEERKSQ